ncbi:assimilatory nitrate reductase NasA [Halovenus sp. HT40]|uniref:assimilatory nitrate reductase NasA n=1 Tax=Halovenus sp. HT40 TaxID=3126691 RepID=UPI003FA6066E
MRCAVGCGHLHQSPDLGVGIDIARGDVNHPVNRGLACSRGIEESQDPDGEWLTKPMVRRDGNLVRTTWDVALNAALEALRDAHESDPNAIGILGSGQQTNEAAYLLGKLARGGFGTRYYDANTTLCMASAVTAYYQAFGSDAPPCTYDDISDADRHIVWGANPAVAHPVMFRWIKQAAGEDGVELTTVDPVRSETAENSDQHVSLAPGKDLALIRAVLARLLETDRIDEAFVEQATDGFDELVDSLPDAEAARQAADVSEGDLELLASALDEDALIYWGMGINQHVQGTETARGLIDLCLATGNLEPGSGPFSLTGQANSMGTRVCSSKGTWPGHRPFEDPDERQFMAEQWGVPTDRLPDDTGPGPVGLLETVEDDIDVIWTVATNPVAGMPDAEQATDRLDDAFVIAQDAFHTETTELADVVLPAATWGESEGTAINMERTVSRVRAATEAPSGVRSDLALIATIGNRLFPELIDTARPDPAAVFEEFAALTEGTPADCSGISYERLEENLAVRWPAPDEESAGGYRYYEPADPSAAGSTDSAVTDGGTATPSWSFPTATGNAQFSTAGQGALPEPTDDAYPLTLTTAREADGYNTGIRSRTVDDPDPVVARIHPETIATHEESVTDGRTRIASRRGGATVELDPDEGVPEGMVWLPIHHPATNRLTLPDRDPQSDEPHFKQCAVRFEEPDTSS